MSEEIRIEITEPKRVRELLTELGLFEEEVLVLVNGKLTTEDAKLKPGDEIRILRVVSSG